MADPNTKRRYIVISGNDLPPLTCRPEELPEMIKEFTRDEISEPVTLTDIWLTDDEYESLGDWSP